MISRIGTDQQEATMKRFVLGARITLVTVSAVAAFTLSQSAMAAPSLNCDAPKGRVERKICRNSDLVQLHNTMMVAYVRTERRIRPRSDVAGLIVDQARWIERRNSCWLKRCITAAYNQRTESLRGWAVIRDD
jgi:uncharacterized protein